MPRGDDLAQLVRNVTTAERRVMGAAARATRDVLREQVEAGFAQGHDVHGKPYKLPKDGHTPPMVRKGYQGLRGAYRFPITEGGPVWLVHVVERTGYGQYLRDGTWKMDPRQHIPKPEEAVPAAWDAKIQPAQLAAVNRVMS